MTYTNCTNGIVKYVENVCIEAFFGRHRIDYVIHSSSG